MRLSIAITVLGVLGMLAAESGNAAFAQPTTKPASISVPRGSRAIASDQAHQHFVSSRTFRKTIVHFRKQLSRNGYLHVEHPTYAYRQVVVSRFVASGKNPGWNAVHVFRIKGKTFISIIR